MLKYDRMTIVMHWLTAGLIVVMWLLPQAIDLFPRGSFMRSTLLGSHIAVGFLTIAVLAVRVGWRASGGRNLPAEPGWQGWAAKAMHHLLYVAVAAALVLGVTNAWVRGDSVFGLLHFTSFAPGDRATRRLIGGMHELAANAVLILAGLHGAMALAHHYVLKDGVLRRMLPQA